MFRRFDRAIFLVILLVICCTAAFAGKVELTTYYPAPNGEYRTLSAKGNDTSNSTVAFQAGGSAGTGLVVTNANNVGIGTAAPVAALEVTSTTSGLIPPRMGETGVGGSGRGSIASPVNGTVIYNTSSNALEYYNGAKWTRGGSLQWRTVVGSGIAGDIIEFPRSDLITHKATGLCVCSDMDTPGALGAEELIGSLESVVTGSSTHTVQNTVRCDTDDLGACRWIHDHHWMYLHYLVAE